MSKFQRGLQITFKIFFLFASGALAAESTSHIFVLKNNLKVEQSMRTQYWDLQSDEMIVAPLTGEESYEIRLTANARGQITTLELKEVVKAGVTPPTEAKVYLLNRTTERGPFQRCLEYLSKEYLCFAIEDLAPGNDLLSTLTIRILPSWVMYSKPIYFSYNLRWRDRETPIAVEHIEQGKAIEVSAIELQIKLGRFLVGIHNLKNEIKESKR